MSQVHRFDHAVALYSGSGSTVYLDPTTARLMGLALIACAHDIRTRPSFVDSKFVTQEFSDGFIDDGKRYKIVRFFQRDGSTRVIKRGLTIGEARAHCHDPETSSSTAKGRIALARTRTNGPWFDGFEVEK